MIGSAGLRHGGVFVFAAAVMLCAAAVAGQQSAPAGNEHPQTRILSDRGAVNPFGAPPVRSALGTEEKHAFAGRVDLEPLRDLAVYHNGRVKILDTLARETVSRIAGRKDYFDLLPRGDGEGADRLRYDPLFTFLDIVIDPGYYTHRPLLHVDFLPLRRLYVERAFPGDGERQEKWLRRLRISPAMFTAHTHEIADRYGADPSHGQGIGRVNQAFELFTLSAGNLLLVAPESEELQWRSVESLPGGAGVGALFREMGEAWRAGDAEGVNSAALAIAGALPAINEHVYPTHRRSLELMYNRSNAFEWGYLAYLVSFVLLLLAFGTGRRWLIGAGIAALLLAMALHGFGFVTRCVIAERFAIQNQFESMTGVSLFATVVGAGLMIARRQWLFGAAAAGVGFLVLVAATETGIPGQHIEREAAILNTSVLLKYHVTTVLVSYGLISLGFLVSLFYLATHYLARRSVARAGAGGAPAAVVNALNIDAEGPRGHRRTLSDLDTAQLTVLQLAFWTLGVGILLGAWWADHSWGRWWAFDPKETWALITWIVYLVVIHVRQTNVKDRGLVTAWLSVLGFFVMLWTYFGVNLLLPGLHAYA